MLGVIGLDIILQNQNEMLPKGDSSVVLLAKFQKWKWSKSIAFDDNKWSLRYGS